MTMANCKLNEHSDYLWNNKNLICLEKRRLLRQTNRFFYGKYENDPEAELIQECCKKGLAPECILLYSVYKNNLKNVQWFLDKNVLPGISLLTSCCYRQYETLSCFEVAQYKKIAEERQEYEAMVNLCMSADRGIKRNNEINIDLCMTSCIGDIEAFEKIIQKNENPDRNKNSMLLVILAATKNFDIDFLKNLQRHSEYKEYMQAKSDKFLRFAFFGRSLESIYYVPKLFNHYVFSHSRIEKIKKLLASDCFELLNHNHDCQSCWYVSPADHMKEITEKNINHPDYENLKKAYNFIFQKTTDALIFRKQEEEKANRISFMANPITEGIAYLIMYGVLNGK